ncbi:MAG TPA: hypothetical protein VF337_07860 [Candidatus Limnocylindrales bacterium]
MSHMPSVLCRAGAALCACVILGGVLTGCTPKKTTQATPSPSATLNPHYSKSTELAASLKTLGPVIGNIQGTMTVGGDERTLTGSVALNATSSRIILIENGTTSTRFEETVVDGNRYTSHDDTTWAYRGTKAKGQDLPTLLANADTTLDAGVSTVAGVTGHMIMTAPDKMDVAPALGLDPWTFDQETTTLHVWADEAGQVLGFGASMSWKVMIGEAMQDVTANLDVMFAAKTTPVDIATPKDPWKWVQDTPAGFAYADPGDLGGVKHTISSDHQNLAKGVTISDEVKGAVDGLSKKGTVGGTQSMVIDGEDAFWFTYEQSGVHEALFIVVHERVEYMLVVVGSTTDKTKLDALAVQVFSTMEFTR